MTVLRAGESHSRAVSGHYPRSPAAVLGGAASLRSVPSHPSSQGRSGLARQERMTAMPESADRRLWGWVIAEQIQGRVAPMWPEGLLDELGFTKWERTISTSTSCTSTRRGGVGHVCACPHVKF